jgi:hypothetical protein
MFLVLWTTALVLRVVVSLRKMRKDGNAAAPAP